MEVEKIQKKIKGSIGKEIFLYTTVDSTNSVASEIAEKETTDGVVVLTESQNKGRGRLGRQWESPPGVSIYMSIILRPKIDLKDVTLITILAAVACAIAIRRITDLDVALKWPNDLTVSDKKLGGILTELKTGQNKLLFAIVGIGININVDIDTFSDDVKNTATSIKHETGKSFPREEIVAEILDEVDYWYKILNSMEREVLLSKWESLTSTLGREINVTVGNESFTGLAQDIDNDGMLILRLPSGERKKITSGDITYLKRK